MMRLPLILLIIGLTAGPVAASGDAERQKFLRENRLLEEELALARKPDVYMTFQFARKTASIKVRGTLLREMRIHDARFWGSPLSDKAYRLQKKRTFFRPDRTVIQPGQSKENEDVSFHALELADMPSRYTLVLDGGVQMSIRPMTEGIGSAAGNFFYTSAGFLFRPVAMIWYTLTGKPYAVIDLVMDEQDARSVYWSLSEASAVILHHP